jgi:hypothetical protein
MECAICTNCGKFIPIRPSLALVVAAAMRVKGLVQSSAAKIPARCLCARARFAWTNAVESGVYAGLLSIVDEMIE